MRKRIGLALGGGGLKGAAHIGVLKVLDRADLSPDIIAGSSIGAIIAGLYACGYSGEQIYQITDRFVRERPISFGPDIFLLLELGLKWLGKKLKIFNDDVPMPRGLIDNRRIESYLLEITRCRTLREALKPVLITATELHQGELYLFASGEKRCKFKNKVMSLQQRNTQKKYPVKVWEDQNLPLATAMTASASIPGIFTPKEIGQMLFVDGGVLNNVPADLLRVTGADIVIAVDLGFTFQDDEKILDPIDVLLQSSDIMGTYITRTRLEGYAHIILHPDLLDYGLKDLARYREIIRAGEEAALKILPEIKKML